MSLKDTLTFQGSKATQLLRTQHIRTVELSEGFLDNGVELKEFLDHIKFSINVHFVLEEGVLFPIFRPILQKYLEMEEPIRVIMGEHISVKRLYQAVSSPVTQEGGTDIESSDEEKTIKSGQIAKIMLQHVYKEENGLFGLVDKFMPDEIKEETQSKLEQKMKSLS
jgi:iron-sulfur cluster repair protein YtfE (RIC family)